VQPRERGVVFSLAQGANGLFFPDTLSGDFFCAVRSAEKGQETPIAEKLRAGYVKNGIQKLFRSKINRIFVR
ncbi:MAG: hypothetical protein K2L09_06665, partial [Alistipes sp.]|nr:hypothetical protein [Alistipes sp.]